MRKLVAVLLVALPVVAQAMLPDSGWYWNPSEPGRGFNIEIQNNVLFMAGFIYDGAGNPVWVTTAGVMASDRTYAGDLVQTSGGQCVGCAYSRPRATKIGTVLVTFPTSTTATVTINGTVLNVQREQFGLDFSNPATPLLGEWVTTTGSPILPSYFGDRFKLSSTSTGTSGLTAFGTRTGDPVRVVVGAFIASTGQWGFLVDSSASYFTVYSFSFTGFNAVQGISSTFLKGTNPVGSLDFFGHRISSGADVAGLNAPGAKAAIELDLDGQDRARVAAQRYDKSDAERLAVVVRELVAHGKH